MITTPFHLPFLPLVLSLSISVCSAESSHHTIRNTSLEIDTLMEEHYESLGVKAQPFIDDATFLRRSYVNIIGRIPTMRESERFLKSTGANKRHELIDSLIDSPGYKHRMFNMYADMLRLKTNFQSSGVAWHLWLKEAVDQNRPYDEMVYDMLSADGHIRENPAVAYYLRDPNMLLDNVSNSVQIFLGTQIGCAQCHDDPFEDTTQMQYYQLAAFSGETVYNKSVSARERIRELGQERRKSLPLPVSTKKTKKRDRKNNSNALPRDIVQLFKQFRRSEVNTLPGKKIQLPHDYPYNDGEPNQEVEPQTLFGNMPNLHDHDSPKEAFASWVTSRENPMFTKTIVNRLWAEVFGYGLAEPLDNWTPSTKASHPETLALLEEVMKVTNFNIKETMRVLYHTALFQREVTKLEVTQGKRHDFTGPVLRRLSAEELYDSHLTIEHGNLDRKSDDKIKEGWEEHLSYISTLLDAPLAQITKMSEDYASYEKQRYAKQAEQSKARLLYEKAKGAKNTDEMAKLRKQLDQLSKDRKALANEDEYTKIVASLTQPAVRARTTKAPLRSSELPSPHRPSSIMRQFGSSDRETSDAAHTRASIPQLLSIFNGPAIARISDRKGRLAQLIKQANSPEERLETIFLSIYTCSPTDSERETLLPMIKNPADTATVIRAMLTSKRFLFLQ